MRPGPGVTTARLAASEERVVFLRDVVAVLQAELQVSPPHVPVHEGVRDLPACVLFLGGICLGCRGTGCCVSSSRCGHRYQ